MRRMFLATTVLVLLPLGVQAVPGQSEGRATQRKIPCKTPENASMCYWTRGRLAVYEGWPPWRMWKVGTKRILAIYSGPSTWAVRGARMNDAADPEFPSNLVRAYPRPTKSAIPPAVFADFEVCPLDEDRPGVMQHACIESARNIFVQKPE